jgi:Phage conserved hypothetical protein BR0599
MSFLSIESSAQDGRPVFLLKVSRTGKEWLYTNADQNIVFDSQTYLAVPVSITGISQTGDAKAENVEVKLPTSASICTYLESVTPTEALKIVLRKIHMSEDVPTSVLNAPALIDAPIVWVGEVVDFGRPTLNSRVLTCNTLALSLARGGLRLSWGRNCPHVLYGRGCLLNKELYATTLTGVHVIDGVTLGATEFGSNGNNVVTPISILDECTTLTGWLKSLNSAVYDYSSIVGIYTGGNSFFSSAEHNESTPAWAIKDFTVAGFSNITMETVVVVRGVSGNDSAALAVMFDTTLKGNGVRILLAGRIGVNMGISICNTGSFLGGFGAVLSSAGCSTAISTGVAYKIVATKTTASGVVTIVAQVYVGAALVGSTTLVSTTSAIKSGGHFGLISLHGDDQIDVSYEYFLIGSSGILAPAGFSGGFIEWESEPGVLERTGIEFDSTGQARVFGTTHGMAGGSNFRAFVGCDRTANTCHNTFRNMLNYGGINHMQGRSPFDGQPIF